MKIRQPRRPTAFTLVELLVVIAIIGMLMALLFPAVNAARERGRTTVCGNNMRNLAFAIMQYESKKNRYPAIFGNKYVRANNFVERPLIYEVLPELGQGNLYNRYKPFDYDAVLDPMGLNEKIPDFDAAGNPAGNYLEILICPSDPQVPSQNPSPLSYVFNAGKVVAAGTLEQGNKAHGVFFEFGGMSSSSVTNNDGLGTTLMLSENLDAGDWNVWYSAHAIDALPTDSKGWQVEFAWWDVADNPAGTWAAHSINGRNSAINPSLFDQIATNYNYARPSSNHGGGVNVAFCDGNVRFINDRIEYKVYVQLMTPNSLQAQSSNVDVRFKLQENQY